MTYIVLKVPLNSNQPTKHFSVCSITHCSNMIAVVCVIVMSLLNYLQDFSAEVLCMFLPFSSWTSVARNNDSLFTWQHFMSLAMSMIVCQFAA